ncbi:cyclase family protein [Amorphus sp. 3PC139-8]|uniref:cyclase family protein n=1 Tax=Amorphus sp. 3PC139-8 TaxID=2735676 RepID=UPI00345E04A1
MTASDALQNVASMLLSGQVEVVDLAVPLGPDTPLIKLPDQFKQTPPVKVHEISNYDDNGPFWSWNWYELGEHSGTHFDAPVHWITGKDYEDGFTDSLPPQSFVAPVNVIDCSKETAENPDFLLTVEGIKAWEAEHGEIEAGTWVVMRTDWWPRNRSQDDFLNVDENGPHSPGPTAEAIQFLIDKGICGWGTECVGTDAGAAGGFEPPFPAHNLLHKNKRLGLASLAHLDKLPAKGAILIAAPLKFVKGTGSPIRALALVPKA